MTDYSFDVSKVLCTCGTYLTQHKNGRCADAILHRLAYDEIPTTHPAGTRYIEGIREQTLFDDGLLVEREGDLLAVPEYTNHPGDAFKILNKWYDIGGTGRFNMNRSGWSGTFHHGILRHSYGYGRMSRARLEWLTIRELAIEWIKFLRASRSNDCDWLEGVDPVVEDANDGG